VTHAIDPERLVLFCPRCRAQHEDFGEWAERPHRTHRCLFCEHEWRPFPWTTTGVALKAPPGEPKPALVVPLAVFQRLSDYSLTLPTGTRPFRHWRRRWPFRSIDRDAESHHFAIMVPMPHDRPGEISIIWRRLLVAEWLAGDALAALLGSAA
jgi:hypothetical protein